MGLTTQDHPKFFSLFSSSSRYPAHQPLHQLPARNKVGEGHRTTLNLLAWWDGAWPIPHSQLPDHLCHHAVAGHPVSLATSRQRAGSHSLAQLAAQFTPPAPTRGHESMSDDLKLLSD